MGFSYYRNGLKSARAFFERDPSELSNGESWDEPMKSASAPLCQTHQGYLWDPIKFQERFLRIVSHSWQIARAPLIPSSGEAHTDKTILSLRNSPGSQRRAR